MRRWRGQGRAGAKQKEENIFLEGRVGQWWVRGAVGREGRAGRGTGCTRLFGPHTPPALPPPPPTYHPPMGGGVLRPAVSARQL